MCCLMLPVHCYRGKNLSEFSCGDVCSTNLQFSYSLFEMWNCPYSNNSFPTYAEDIDAGLEASPSTAMLAEVARKKKVTIVAGSIPERSGGNLYNTCCVFDKNGELKAKFRKVLKLSFECFNGTSRYFQNVHRTQANALGCHH
jgi:hypothetical protein